MPPSAPPLTSKSSLVDLPSELLRSIASHLNKRSAAALALTCRSLQEVGESIVWRELSLTDRDLLLVSTSLHSASSQSYIPVTPVLSSYSSVTPSSASHSLIQTILTLLRAQSWRPTQLHVLFLDLRFELPSSLLDVLTLATGLKHLELRSPAPSFTMSSYSLTATLDLFRALPHPLPSLRHLRLDVRYRWNETVVEIVEKVPNLECLHILSHPRRISGGVPPLRSKVIPTTVLPRLREVIIDEMEQSFVRTLVPLIDAAKGLEAVALRDHAHRWKPTPTCPLLTALASKERLKRLECTSFIFPFLRTPEAFESLEALSVLWSTDLAYSHKKPDLIIPPLPNLQRYQLEISLHSSTSDMDLNRHILILPKIASNILTLASAHLYTCPKLATIYLPPHLDYASRQNEICPSPPHPDSADFTGMVVRSFASESTTSLTEGRELIHCRAKIANEFPLRLHPDGWAEPGMGDGSSSWIERVMREDGRELPNSVLAAMYSAAGLRMGQTPLSREGVLPEVCWRILRRWELQDDGGF